MDPIILMQSKWGETYNIPWYLFLGGMSGGILIISALAEIFGGNRPRHSALAGLSALLNLPFMVVVGLALSFHLARPLRGFLFPLYMTNYDSWLTIGGWIIMAFLPISILVTLAWYFEVSRAWRMLISLIALPIGILMCLYTGYLLTAVQFVPLWAPQFLPILFLLSGISTGLAACTVNAYLVKILPFPHRVRERLQDVGLEKSAHTLGNYEIFIVILEVVWIFMFILALSKGSVGHRVAGHALVKGELSTWFWMGVVLIGLALPILLSILEPILKKVYNRESGWAVGWPLFAKLHLVLLGGLILRHVIVWGGDIKQPLFFPSQMAAAPTVSAGQGSAQALSQALKMIHRR